MGISKTAQAHTGWNKNRALAGTNSLSESLGEVAVYSKSPWAPPSDRHWDFGLENCHLRGIYPLAQTLTEATPVTEGHKVILKPEIATSRMISEMHSDGDGSAQESSKVICKGFIRDLVIERMGLTQTCVKSCWIPLSLGQCSKNSCWLTDKDMLRLWMAVSRWILFVRSPLWRR